MYQTMKPTSSVTPRIPPTTPPAIAPVFELFFEPELPVVVEVAPALDDVDVVDGAFSGVSINRERKQKS